MSAMIKHERPSQEVLHEMGRDYLLAHVLGYSTEDAERVWSDLDQQLAAETLAAELQIMGEHRDEPEGSFRAAAAILTARLDYQRMHDVDKFSAMTLVAVDLLDQLVRRTGRDARAVLMSCDDDDAAPGL